MAQRRIERGRHICVDVQQSACTKTMRGQRDRHLGHGSNPHLCIGAERDRRGFPAGPLREAGGKGKDNPSLAPHHETCCWNLARLHQRADALVRR